MTSDPSERSPIALVSSPPRFSHGLFVDLYELTMMQACFEEQLQAPAVFSLFVRRLPARRNYLLACGVEDVLDALEAVGFDQAALAYLESLGRFSSPFLDYLGGLRFSGAVHAVAEGTPVFAEEPLLEVEAPLPEAQLVESIIINQMQLQTALASKAARVVDAAGGREVIDFGMRRAHGTDAAMKGARAFHVAGVHATSNVAAGQVYGLRVSGTLAHSYVQAHDDELEAFRRFSALYPGTVLLVDTYDTMGGVRKVIEIARELGTGFRVRAIRIDSGDLGAAAAEARQLLDQAGLSRVGILVSGNLNEDAISRLIDGGAPVDGFGVGTEMAVSSDAPSLDIVYKLVEYGGRGRMKLSKGKPLLPGRKQVYRIERDGVAMRDVIARRDEAVEGRPLLHQVMAAGRRLQRVDPTAVLEGARDRAARERGMLPAPVRGLVPASPPYPVEISTALALHRDAVAAAFDGRGAHD